jgi:hypothetical protein
MFSLRSRNSNISTYISVSNLVWDGYILSYLLIILIFSI